MTERARFEITISERVDDPSLLVALCAAPDTSVLSEPLSDGSTKITVEGATFRETILHLRCQLTDQIENARLGGLSEANEEPVG